MELNKGWPVIAVMLLGVQLANSAWLKRYEENYHRPHYYNRAHRSDQHVDYNREAMNSRDARAPVYREPMPEFDPKVHKSYYVNILYKGSAFCPGALISHRMIITSARCFLPNEIEPTLEFKAKNMKVITGNDFARTSNKPVNVIAFFMPAPRNISMGVPHNIALVALDKKLDRKIFRYIKLYSRLPKTGYTVDMAYMEANSFEITLYSTKVTDTEHCKKTFEDANIKIPFKDEFFCVANKRKGVCNTRPGDPLIFENKLAGINIYGEQCDELGDFQKNDVYVSIHHSIGFLQTATDLLRAFTGSGPFNHSLTTKRTQLHVETTTIKGAEEEEA